MRESTIEKKFRAEVKKLGGIAVKNWSTGNKSLPDRTCYLPGGLCILAELKAPGKEVTQKQQLKINHFRKLGFSVFVVDDMESVSLFSFYVKALLQKQLKTLL